MATLSNISAECAVLSAAVYKQEWLLDVLQSLNIEDFTHNGTRAVFSVLETMHRNNEKITIETVMLHARELADAGYDSGNDLTYTQMLGSVPMPNDFSGYLSTLKEYSARRSIVRAAQTAENMIQHGEMAETAYAELERLVMERTATDMTREMISPQEMANAIIDAIEERTNHDKRNKRVVYTTFGSFNRLSGGLEKGDLIILSAESGAGKSAFAMNLSHGVAVINKRPLLYLNSEMSKNQFSLRWAAHLGRVSHRALRNGNATNDEVSAAIHAAEVIYGSKLWTLNMPDMKISSVLAEVRRAKAKYGIEVAVVDYIGRMDSINAKDFKEWQMLKSGAQRLKTLAQELDITVIMVAQLTSDGSKLAQSSYMMHEADLWINLSKIKEENLLQNWPWNYCLDFRKARNVEVGQKVMMRFDGDTLTFTDSKSKAEEMAGEKPLLAGAVTTTGRKADVPL